MKQMRFCSVQFEASDFHSVLNIQCGKCKLCSSFLWITSLAKIEEVQGKKKIVETNMHSTYFCQFPVWIKPKEQWHIIIRWKFAESDEWKPHSFAVFYIQKFTLIFYFVTIRRKFMKLKKTNMLGILNTFPIPSMYFNENS